MVDQNSDTWVIEQNSPELVAQIDELRKKYQWTDLMDHLVGELHKRGTTRQQILQALARIPFSSDMVEVLKVIKGVDGEIVILSDANVVYIEEILKAYGVCELVSCVISNPASWDENGRLHIRRLIPKDESHGCKNPCAENICKGKELVDYISSGSGYDRIIYVGDSINDFCPATKMSSDDILFARKGYRLEKFLKDISHSSPDSKYKDVSWNIKPRVIYWEDGRELLNNIKVELEMTVTRFYALSLTSSDLSAVELGRVCCRMRDSLLESLIACIAYNPTITAIENATNVSTHDSLLFGSNASYSFRSTRHLLLGNNNNVNRMAEDSLSDRATSVQSFIEDSNISDIIPSIIAKAVVTRETIDYRDIGVEITSFAHPAKTPEYEQTTQLEQGELSLLSVSTNTEGPSLIVSKGDTTCLVDAVVDQNDEQIDYANIRKLLQNYGKKSSPDISVIGVSNKPEQENAEVRLRHEEKNVQVSYIAQEFEEPREENKRPTAVRLHEGIGQLNYNFPRFGVARDDNESLKYNLRDFEKLRKENEYLRLGLQESKKISKENEHLKLNLQEFRKENENLRSSLQDFRKENEHLKSSLQELERFRKENEQLNFVSSEIEKLREKNAQLVDMLRSFEKSHNDTEQSGSVPQEVAKLRDENEKLKLNLNNQLESKNRELKLVREENERVKLELHSRKKNTRPLNRSLCKDETKGSKLDETRRNIHKDKLYYKLKLARVDHMDFESLAERFKEVMITLRVDDADAVVTSLERISNVMRLVPQLRDFINTVVRLVLIDDGIHHDDYPLLDHIKCTLGVGEGNNSTRNVNSHDTNPIAINKCNNITPEDIPPENTLRITLDTLTQWRDTVRDIEIFAAQLLHNKWSKR
ncbi:1881_t:CDS:10 [Acaulospora morrowiae]|uniref:1881_t:CDS:1 n=1 Tax=Acaulospora morrowiae TaxID=94023 RepID=A0A9N9F4D5_9GLOM|nr:1881_t:CDS:10 [Acaulospora morrowiae]